MKKVMLLKLAGIWTFCMLLILVWGYGQGRMAAVMGYGVKAGAYAEGSYADGTHGEGAYEEGVYEEAPGSTAEQKKICITFDDGPHPYYTEQLLDGLKERGVKATFFVTGDCVMLLPD